MSQGFITLATGDDRYYKLAYNLLKSYHFRSSTHYPFAIVADRENKYTDHFDDVIIISNPTKSYLDKIKLLSILPYDKNIFIDADCLLYSDINHLFSKADWRGVTMFGENNSLDSNALSWFEKNNLCEYTGKVHFKLDTHGGIMFLTKDPITKAIYDDCIRISEHYYDFKFRFFNNPADEPIIALAMAANNCKAIPLSNNKDVYVFIPLSKSIKMDFVNGLLSYSEDGVSWIEKVSILHWQNENTTKPRYSREVFCIEHNNKLIIHVYYYLCYVKYGFVNIYNKFYRIAKDLYHKPFIQKIVH